jgi:glycosyltransferase involved in cell wall biosynthesis
VNQRFKDFEVYLIDGCSTDTTLITAKPFTDTLDMKILSEPDKGIYDAMNKGIHLSSGTWIYFLGSDDQIYSNDVFEKIFNSKLIRENDVIYGNVTSPRFNGVYDGEFDSDKLYEKNICHQALFIKRSVFEKVGFFNIKNKVYADWEHNMRWFYNRSIKHQFVNITVAHYADGGYSSVNSDSSFLIRKQKIALTLGFFLSLVN